MPGCLVLFCFYNPGSTPEHQCLDFTFIKFLVNFVHIAFLENSLPKVNSRVHTAYKETRYWQEHSHHEYLIFTEKDLHERLRLSQQYPGRVFTSQQDFLEKFPSMLLLKRILCLKVDCNVINGNMILPRSSMNSLNMNILFVRRETVTRESDEVANVPIALSLRSISSIT